MGEDSAGQVHDTRNSLARSYLHTFPALLILCLGASAFLTGPCGVLGYDRPTYLLPASGEVVSAVHFEMDGILRSANLTRTSHGKQVASQVRKSCKDNDRCTKVVFDLLEERLRLAADAEDHRQQSCYHPHALFWNFMWFLSPSGMYRWFLRVECVYVSINGCLYSFTHFQNLCLHRAETEE